MKQKMKTDNGGINSRVPLNRGKCNNRFWQGSRWGKGEEGVKKRTHDRGGGCTLGFPENSSSLNIWDLGTGRSADMRNFVRSKKTGKKL